MLIDSKKLELAMARACIDKVRMAEKAGVTYPSVMRSTIRKGKILSIIVDRFPSRIQRPYATSCKDW